MENSIALRMAKTLWSTLLHSEWQKTMEYHIALRMDKTEYLLHSEWPKLWGTLLHSEWPKTLSTILHSEWPKLWSNLFHSE